MGAQPATPRAPGPLMRNRPRRAVSLHLTRAPLRGRLRPLGLNVQL
jgi:hypothetical protein